MIVVVGSFRLPPAAVETARPAMERVVAASRAERGCIAYSYAEDVLEPGLIRVSEAWSDRAALTAHFTAEHMTTWQRERAALGMSDRAVRAYDAGREEAL